MVQPGAVDRKNDTDGGGEASADNGADAYNFGKEGNVNGQENLYQSWSFG